MRVLIISGGISSERKISLISAGNVKQALRETGYEVKIFELKKGLRVFKKVSQNFDVIFPVIHGEEGEGGKLQKFLIKLGKPYVGGNPDGFKKAWYKIPCKEFCQRNNILTSPWKKIKTKKDIEKFGFPCVLKSSNGGSSKEVVILKSKHDLNNALINKLLKSGAKLFVEKYLRGIEITVAVLQNRALPVVEIIPPKGGWFDYKNKYSGQTREVVGAPSVDPNLQKLAQKVATKIHKTLKLGQFSRTDFIISQGKLYLLEVNTIPGLTSQSLFPKAAQEIGISFSELLDRIIKLAIK